MPSFVHVESDSDERISIGHDSNLAEDEQAEMVISVFGSATSAGRVADQVVSVFGDSSVTGPVGNQVIAVFGNVYVNSKVQGQVVAVFGDVVLGPNAEVDDQVISVSGTVTRAPGAIVRGSVRQFGLGNAVAGPGLGLRAWYHDCFLRGRLLAFNVDVAWAWWIALGLLGLYTGFALLFRSGIEQCVATLQQRPGRSMVTVLLVALLTPVVMFLLAITGVGLVVIPFLAAALFIGGLFGRAVILAWLGRNLSGNMLGTTLATLAGGVAVALLYTVPVLGMILWKAIGLLGLGVVIYTLLLNFRRDRVPAGLSGVPPAGAIPPTTDRAPASAGFTSSPQADATFSTPAVAQAAVTAMPLVSPHFGSPPSDPVSSVPSINWGGEGNAASAAGSPGRSVYVNGTVDARGNAPTGGVLDPDCGNGDRRSHRGGFPWRDYLGRFVDVAGAGGVWSGHVEAAGHHGGWHYLRPESDAPR